MVRTNWQPVESPAGFTMLPACGLVYRMLLDNFEPCPCARIIGTFS